MEEQEVLALIPSERRRINKNLRIKILLWILKIKFLKF